MRLDELALVILAACGGGDQRTPAANGQPAKAPPSGAGLAGVKQTEGALGYVELIYASANELPYAELKNAAAVRCTLTRVGHPGCGRGAVRAEHRFSGVHTNAPGQNSYPISSFSWLLIRPTMTDSARAKALTGFLEWMITPEAQDMAAQLVYAPLPKQVITLVEERIAQLGIAH